MRVASKEAACERVILVIFVVVILIIVACPGASIVAVARVGVVVARRSWLVLVLLGLWCVLHACVFVGLCCLPRVAS